MNCRPKEMATVVRCHSLLGNLPEGWLGLTVQVDCIVQTPQGPTWSLVQPVKAVSDKPLYFTESKTGREHVVPAGTEVTLTSMPDDYLQPWRAKPQEKGDAIPLMQRRTRTHQFMSPAAKALLNELIDSDPDLKRYIESLKSFPGFPDCRSFGPRELRGHSILRPILNARNQ